MKTRKIFWSRGVYRYATAPAINIARKVDGEDRVGGTVLTEVLSLAFTTKRRKDTSSSSGAVSPPPSSPVSFSLAMHAALDSAVVEVHFIPTFNKAVRAPPGLY